MVFLLQGIDVHFKGGNYSSAALFNQNDNSLHS